jgi:cobyrinic acid a,c-diamide synthase
MRISNQLVAQKLTAYLRHEIDLRQLVDWAENAILEAEFDPQSSAQLPHVVARLGVADVRAFGLSWDECESLLKSLGYDVRVEVTPA